jgi:hypothetical protein
MSTDRDVTRIVRSWLEEGTNALPDRVLDKVLDELPATRQRRAWWPAWRLREMNNTLRIAVAAIAVLAVVLIGVNLLPRQGGVGAPGQAPSPSLTPSPTASPSPSPSPSPSLGPSPAGIRDGPLAAGRYTTMPFSGDADVCMGQAGCTESAADNSIRVTLTVPDGWAGIGGTIYRAVENNSPPGGAGLLFSRGPWLYSKPCGRLPVPDVPTGTTVDDFVTALVEHPDLDVTRPVDVTLGGYSGKYLELQAPANIATNQDNPAAGECTYYFVWDPGIYAQGPNHLWHIWVLDVDGVRVVVRSDTYPGTAAAVKAQLAAMVDSIQIAP